MDILVQNMEHETEKELIERKSIVRASHSASYEQRETNSRVI